MSRSIGDALAQRGVAVEVLVPAWPQLDRDSRVHALDAAGLHPSDVIVAALSVGRGDWFAFLEGGDRWHPEHLHGALRRAEETSASWVYGGAALLGADGGVIGRRAAVAPRELASSLRSHNVIGGASSVVCSRELLAERRPFDRGFSSHVLWVAWIALATARSASTSGELVAERYEEDRAVLDPRDSLSELRRMRSADMIDGGDRRSVIDLAARLQDLGHRRTAARAYALSAVQHRHPADLGRAVRALRSRGPRPSNRVAAPAWLEGTP